MAWTSSSRPLRARPGEVTLVTLGPVTNLACAILREPELPHLLRRWVLMGGCFRVPGNTTPREEWNIHCDPDAAQIAFAAFGRAGVSPRPMSCPQDGRSTFCVLTDKGRALRAKMWPIYRKQIDTLFGKHLEAREAESLAATFETMIDSMRGNTP